MILERTYFIDALRVYAELLAYALVISRVRRGRSYPVAQLWGAYGRGGFLVDFSAYRRAPGGVRAPLGEPEQPVAQDLGIPGAAPAVPIPEGHVDAVTDRIRQQESARL
jgi:hypothetical protein